MDTNTLAIVLQLMAAQRPPSPSNALAIVTLILAALGPLIAAIAASFARSNQLEATKLKEHINSRMDELQKETKKASFAEGAASTAVAMPVAVRTVEPNAVTPDMIAQIVAAIRASEIKPNSS